MLGEIVFGGVGVGLCRYAHVCPLSRLFFSGLMVGRTPEYMGKKIEKERCNGSYCHSLSSCLILIRSKLCAVSLPQMLFQALQIQALMALPKSSMPSTSSQEIMEVHLQGLNPDTAFYNIALGVCHVLGQTWLYLFQAWQSVASSL